MPRKFASSPNFRTQEDSLLEIQAFASCLHTSTGSVLLLHLPESFCYDAQYVSCSCARARMLMNQMNNLVVEHNEAWKALLLNRGNTIVEHKGE